MTSKKALPPLPGSRAPSAPSHLEKPEKTMWRELMAAHQFDDPASLALLRTTLEAHQRARRCREAIDREGETVKDRFDQIKPHPLLAAERDARSAFLVGMRALNLDTTGV
jgi:P27 family predicted phage terminase small subunit